MHYKELSTPALTINLDVLEANLDRMARYCKEHGLGLRPHTKTHKTPELGRMQVGRGAVGLTVAKVGEAEVMAGAGLDDILVAYPIWGAENFGAWRRSRAPEPFCSRSITRQRHKNFHAPWLLWMPPSEC